MLEQRQRIKDMLAFDAHQKDIEESLKYKDFRDFPIDQNIGVKQQQDKLAGYQLQNRMKEFVNVTQMEHAIYVL